MIMNFEREREREVITKMFQKVSFCIFKTLMNHSQRNTCKTIYVWQPIFRFIFYYFSSKTAICGYEILLYQESEHLKYVKEFSYLMILHCILFMHLTHRDFLFIWYVICQNYAITRDFEVYVIFSSSSD